jgi:hypothetical protein
MKVPSLKPQRRQLNGNPDSFQRLVHLASWPVRKVCNAWRNMASIFRHSSSRCPEEAGAVVQCLGHDPDFSLLRARTVSKQQMKVCPPSKVEIIAIGGNGGKLLNGWPRDERQATPWRKLWLENTRRPAVPCEALPLT